MFSGIVEEFATVVAIEKDRENKHFTLTCSFVDELKIDQSVAHNGVCLTVVSIDTQKKTYVVTAMKETLERSNLGDWQVGTRVNVERSMLMNGRLDGRRYDRDVRGQNRPAGFVDLPFPVSARPRDGASRLPNRR